MFANLNRTSSRSASFSDVSPAIPVKLVPPGSVLHRTSPISVGSVTVVKTTEVALPAFFSASRSAIADSGPPAATSTSMWRLRLKRRLKEPNCQRRRLRTSRHQQVCNPAGPGTPQAHLLSVRPARPSAQRWSMSQCEGVRLFSAGPSSRSSYRFSFSLSSRPLLSFRS